MHRPSAIELVIIVCLGVVAARTARAEDESALRERAARLHRDAIVVDGHNDVTTWMLDYGFDLGMDGADPAKRPAKLYWVFGWLLPTPRGDALRTDTDLRRLREGGVDAQFFSIFADSKCVDQGPGRCRQRALDMIAALEEQLRRHPGDLEAARTADDVRHIAAAGRIAALMGLEGGHAIENDLSNLQMFYNRGVRYMTLTWNNTNDWADSSRDLPRHNGLTDLGKRVVAEMNELGMIVDVSHVSDKTFWDVIETTKVPVIASHSAARSLADHPRNMSDDMLRAVGRNGGVVMVNFGDLFIDPEKASNWKIAVFALRHLGWPRTPLSVLIDHIDHVARVAGVDHVGLGSDFDGMPFFPAGIEDVSGYLNITVELLRRGYSEEDVRKILGENALRVLSDAEESARLIAGTRETQSGGTR
jgi:membrane dipeptidase